MMKYTIEEIEAAFVKSLNSGIADISVDEFIAELQKPKWTPKVGQIVYSEERPGNIFYWCKQDKAKNWPDLKPVTAKEIGLEPFKKLKANEWPQVFREGYARAIDHVNRTLFGYDDEQ